MKLEQASESAGDPPPPHAFAKDVEQFLAAPAHGRTAFSRRYSTACGCTDRGSLDRLIAASDGPDEAAWRMEGLLGVLWRVLRLCARTLDTDDSFRAVIRRIFVAERHGFFIFQGEHEFIGLALIGLGQLKFWFGDLV